MIRSHTPALTRECCYMKWLSVDSYTRSWEYPLHMLTRHCRSFGESIAPCIHNTHFIRKKVLTMTIWFRSTYTETVDGHTKKTGFWFSVLTQRWGKGQEQTLSISSPCLVEEWSGRIQIAMATARKHQNFQLVSIFEVDLWQTDFSSLPWNVNTTRMSTIGLTNWLIYGRKKWRTSSKQVSNLGVTLGKLECLASQGMLPFFVKLVVTIDHSRMFEKVLLRIGSWKVFAGCVMLAVQMVQLMRMWTSWLRIGSAQLVPEILCPGHPNPRSWNTCSWTRMTLLASICRTPFIYTTLG